jgi:hypothetical protein
VFPCYFWPAFAFSRDSRDDHGAWRKDLFKGNERPDFVVFVRGSVPYLVRAFFLNQVAAGAKIRWSFRALYWRREELAEEHLALKWS